MKRNETHTEDIQDIIGRAPHWLIRWGITWALVVLSSLIALVAFVRYPDIVRCSARINAANAPKQVVSRTAGNIVEILVEENESVSNGQLLGFLESTADHRQVLNLMNQLYEYRDELYGPYDIGAGNSVPYHKSIVSLEAPVDLRIGELQSDYRTFYQSYLTYQAATDSGIYLRRREYLKQDIQNVVQQRKQIERQLEVQQQEYALAELNFKRNKDLASENVISPAEFEQQQAIFLASQYPMMQTGAALLTNESSRTTKMRELADLENQITEESLKFMQALNSLISETEQWKQQYVLVARQAGTVVYAGILQQGQYIEAGQEVFYINPGSTDFFAEIKVPQYNMGKVKQGQRVLIKLNSYPFEEYGVLEAKVGELSGVPYRDSIFITRADLDIGAKKPSIQLTTGMIGSAEIITEDASLLQRLLRNFWLMVEQRK